MKKIMFLLLIISSVDSFSQNQPKDGITGEYKINDSVAAVFANKINELKSKIRELDDNFNRPPVTGKIKYFLPKGNVAFEFFVDTTSLGFEARETIYSDKVVTKVSEFKFYDCSISGYYFTINHSTTYESLEFLFVKRRIEFLLQVLTENLNSATNLGWEG